MLNVVALYLDYKEFEESAQPEVEVLCGWLKHAKKNIAWLNDALEGKNIELEATGRKAKAKKARESMLEEDNSKLREELSGAKAKSSYKLDWDTYYSS